MKTSLVKKLLSCFFLLSCALLVYADGISVDAGLTPAQDRWILRTQYRLMNMYNSGMETYVHAFPLVVVYGLTSKITLMTRQSYQIRNMVFNEKTSQNGFDDPYFLMKIKAFRKNTATYTFGIAPTIASNIPVGNEQISDKIWSPKTGVNCSYRHRFWLFDLNIFYTFQDINKKATSNYNDVLHINSAFSRLFPYKNNSDNLFSPVMEFSYSHEFNTTNTPGMFTSKKLLGSPGFKMVYSSFIFEALYQIPLYQNTPEAMMKSRGNLIVGIRYML
ncbi:MAG: hypothetical protein FVQ77_09275 [Cytophagales bacterium]|nr:hypothetical protein [Cytophagales bacterium]